MSLASLVIARADAGQMTEAEFVSVPPFQFKIYFAELSAICPSLVKMGVERRRANALNIEIGAPLSRCSEQSPDGRGIAWVLSGGTYLSYGVCGSRTCPRAEVRS